jgi:hypothetical protein
MEYQLVATRLIAFHVEGEFKATRTIAFDMTPEIKIKSTNAYCLRFNDYQTIMKIKRRKIIMEQQ